MLRVSRSPQHDSKNTCRSVGEPLKWFENKHVAEMRLCPDSGDVPVNEFILEALERDFTRALEKT